jgi:hypothetical protein
VRDYIILISAAVALGLLYVVTELLPLIPHRVAYPVLALILAGVAIYFLLHAN